MEGKERRVRPIRPEKKGIRALGIAESFVDNPRRASVLCGVVMRSDLVTDGFAFAHSRLEGDDVTDQILAIFRSLKRNDINLIILGGVVLSLYNMADVDKVSAETGLPVIAVTFKESKGLEKTIKRRFPFTWRAKLRAYRKLGKRESLTLRTGHKVFVRVSGTTKEFAKRVLDKFTLQGSVPEPLRVAKLVARACFYLQMPFLSKPYSQ